MKYILVDVQIRQVKVYSNQIDSWMIGGQIRVIARSIIENSTSFLCSTNQSMCFVIRNKKI
jgi:hypothetical protein